MSRFPFPVPHGWFHVGYAADLAPGDVRQVYYFGRDLVLWRDEQGGAHLQDLYCPHLGANLAVGGKVSNVALSLANGFSIAGDVCVMRSSAGRTESSRHSTTTIDD